MVVVVGWHLPGQADGRNHTFWCRRQVDLRPHCGRPRVPPPHCLCGHACPQARSYTRGLENLSRRRLGQENVNSSIVGVIALRASNNGPCRPRRTWVQEASSLGSLNGRHGTGGDGLQPISQVTSRHRHWAELKKIVWTERRHERSSACEASVEEGIRSSSMSEWPAPEYPQLILAIETLISAPPQAMSRGIDAGPPIPTTLWTLLEPLFQPSP